MTLKLSLDVSGHKMKSYKHCTFSLPRLTNFKELINCQIFRLGRKPKRSSFEKKIWTTTIKWLVICSPHLSTTERKLINLHTIFALNGSWFNFPPENSLYSCKPLFVRIVQAVKNKKVTVTKDKISSSYKKKTVRRYCWHA